MGSGIKILSMQLGKSRRQRAVFVAGVENKQYRDLVIYENGSGLQVHYPGYSMNRLDSELRYRVSEKALKHYRTLMDLPDP